MQVHSMNFLARATKMKMNFKSTALLRKSFTFRSNNKITTDKTVLSYVDMYNVCTHRLPYNLSKVSHDF